MTHLITLFVKKNNIELCYYIKLNDELNDEDYAKLKYFLGSYKTSPCYDDLNIYEIGPRTNMETSISSNIISIFNKINLNKITRIEYSIRTPNILQYDKMTHMLYDKYTIELFNKSLIPNKIQNIPYDEITQYNDSQLLGFDNVDLAYYKNLFQNIPVKTYNNNSLN